VLICAEASMASITTCWRIARYTKSSVFIRSRRCLPSAATGWRRRLRQPKQSDGLLLEGSQLAAQEAGSAAIASAVAAEIYGLKILCQNIEDIRAILRVF